MMTGCYPLRIGFGSFGGKWVLFPGHAEGLHSDEMTIGKALQQQGVARQERHYMGRRHTGALNHALDGKHSHGGCQSGATLLHWAGGGVPKDRVVDGCDIRPILLNEDNALAPREGFPCYLENNLQVVWSGHWKLHVWRHHEPVRELYDLDQDIGETINVIDKYPQIADSLERGLNVAVWISGMKWQDKREAVAVRLIGWPNLTR